MKPKTSQCEITVSMIQCFNLPEAGLVKIAVSALLAVLMGLLHINLLVAICTGFA